MSVIDAFLDALWLEQGASDHTLAAYRRDLTAWQSHLESHGEALLAPPPERLSEWLASRREEGYQLRSNARLLSTLRSFYRWGRLNNQVESDPLTDIKLPRVIPGLPNTLEEDEVERYSWRQIRRLLWGFVTVPCWSCCTPVAYGYQSW